MTTESFTAGERRLPGGFAGVCISIGVATWMYAPLPDHGESILTVHCTLGDQVQTPKAQALLP